MIVVPRYYHLGVPIVAPAAITLRTNRDADPYSRFARARLGVLFVGRAGALKGSIRHSFNEALRWIVFAAQLPNDVLAIRRRILRTAGVEEIDAEGFAGRSDPVGAAGMVGKTHALLGTAAAVHDTKDRCPGPA